jgi:hypothetical protein
MSATSLASCACKSVVKTPSRCRNNLPSHQNAERSLSPYKSRLNPAPAFVIQDTPTPVERVVAPLHKQQPLRQSGLMGRGPSLETRPIASSALEAAAGRRAYHVLTNPSVFQIHDTACFPFSLINFLQSNLLTKSKVRILGPLYIYLFSSTTDPTYNLLTLFLLQTHFTHTHTPNKPPPFPSCAATSRAPLRPLQCPPQRQRSNPSLMRTPSLSSASPTARTARPRSSC